MDRLIEVFSNLPWASQIAAWSLRLTTALLVLLLGLWIVRLAANALARLMTRMNVDPMLRDFLSSVLKGVLTVLVLAGALDSLGVPMTSILAALGAAGLAIALALRDSLANLAAGVTLILLKPFRVGDVIEIDQGLIDLLCTLQHYVGDGRPIEVFSAYRTKKTNDWLRRHGRATAKHSLHIEGMAVDMHIPGVRLRTVRDAARALNAGGVGYYPRSGFVHIDTGPVRYW